ncbi:unnamed protein product [Closterium sp. Naga37s-1]|nr:unnamed protein product [Closterium sp. Naga37s-1]
MDGGALSKAGAMAAIAESEVFESGDEDEESRLLWQIMMIEEAAREAAARQRAEAAITADAAMETRETRESTEPAETLESTETQSPSEAPAEFTEPPETAEAVESTEESTQAAEVAMAEVAMAEVAMAETAMAETAAEECANEESAEKSAETESADAERAVAGGTEAESTVVVTPTAADIFSDTDVTAVAAAPNAETAESANAPGSSSSGGGFGGGGIRKSTSTGGLFSLDSATGTTPSSGTVTPVSASAGAAPHKETARAANSGGIISKSTSTGALSSLISARSFRIRGKSSAGGLPFLPALTVPESDSASADHGPLSCSALPSAAAAAPSGSIAPPLTPSRRFSKWFSFKADKAQASSGDNNAAAAKSSAQFLSGKPAIGGFSSAAVSDSSDIVSLGVGGPIAECESEEGRGSTEGRSAVEETSKPKDTSGASGLVSPNHSAPAAHHTQPHSPCPHSQPTLILALYPI